MRLIKYILPLIACVACIGLAHAGHLDIVNENKKPLKMKVEPEGDSKSTFKQEISGENFSSLDFNPTQFNGKSYYSIKGDTSAFTSGGKCEHLSVDKDYKVTFQNDKVGTTCIAEELVKADAIKS